TGAVWPDERDVLAAFDCERGVAEQHALADLQRQGARLDDGSPAARRLQELEAERPLPPREQRDLGARVPALLFEPSDLRELRLRLLRLFLLRAEALDEPLEANDVRLHSRDFLLRIQH